MVTLFPALRWDPDHGFSHLDPVVEAGLKLGVGGFILFGGEAEAVAGLTASLRERAGRPLLIGADLERGAGQQFHGATQLPPLAALGQLGDAELAREAGRITGAEAVALGVSWVYAPVADLDLEPANPIVGTRAFGAEAGTVAPLLEAWIRGAASTGVLTCAKHFPGHGRTTADSHLELPTVDASRETLEVDLAPFRAAIAAGVDAVMTAHVAYPALDPSGAPATLSRPILSDLLRDELGFGGLVVTDAMIMEGLRGGGGEGDAAVRALAAGCDALLYPKELEATAEAVRSAAGGRLDAARLRDAEGRIAAAAARAPEPAGRWGLDGEGAWALEVAERAVRPLRGTPSCPAAVDVVVVDDDVGGPFPHGIPRGIFAATLRAAGVDARSVAAPTGDRPVLVALYADIKGFKGRPGLSASAREAMERAAGVNAGVVLFGHPRLAGEVPADHVLCAWGGEAIMQRAAAQWLTR